MEKIILLQNYQFYHTKSTDNFSYFKKSILSPAYFYLQQWKNAFDEV
jgi:hypothetical protein